MGVKHPATEQILQWFKYDHLKGNGRSAALICHAVAVAFADTIEEGPELTTGLRKLLEAKDCFVRAAIGNKETK